LNFSSNTETYRYSNIQFSIDRISTAPYILKEADFQPDPICFPFLKQTFEESEAKKDETAAEESSADQLTQLIYTFSQGAITETAGDGQADDALYMSYAEIMAKSCGEEDEDEEEGGDEAEAAAEAPSLQEQEIEKMRLLFNQGRLASRGAAEMVLSQISASHGEAGDMIENTLKLGIAILRGGNKDVQTVSVVCTHKV
jgi:ryanodine receptor 2